MIPTSEVRINYDTAKMLYEIGGVLNVNTYNKFQPGYSSADKRLYNYGDTCPAGYRYSAYTQSAIQKWLREEHSVYVFVGQPSDGYYDACVFRDRTNHYRKFDDFTTNKTDFTDYESALEDGLLLALELIKQ